MIPANFASALDADISQHWMLMAAVLGAYFLKDFVFDEVRITKYFAQRRVARSNAKLAASKVASTFPTALTNAELLAVVRKTLKEHGFRKMTTQLGSSFSTEEMNHSLERDFSRVYGDHVPMGGLAGFAWGGLRAFSELFEAMTTNGDALILYGPHVNVNSDGIVGSDLASNSAKKALQYVKEVSSGARKEMTMDDVMDESGMLCMDMEQYFVNNALLPYAERLNKAEDIATELPYTLFEAQDTMMQELVVEGCEKEEIRGFVAMLGGIQISTPKGVSDYFLPLRFELRDGDGQLVKDLMW